MALKNIQPVRVLLIEADGSACRAIELYLRGLTGQAIVIRSASTADQLRLLLREEWDAVLLDADSDSPAQAELMRESADAVGHLPIVKLGRKTDGFITSGAETSLDDSLPKIPVGSAPLFRSVGHLLERRRLERKVEDLEARLVASSDLDSLTGLIGPHHLSERLAHEFNIAHRYHTSLTVCVFEVLGFQAITESYGYEVANQVLHFCGEIIAPSIRNTDFAGRLATGEFCVVLPNTSVSSSLIVVERIRDALARKMFIGKSYENFTVDAAYGVVQLEEGRRSLDELMAGARQAMAAAKNVGPGHIEIAYPASMAG